MRSTKKERERDRGNQRSVQYRWRKRFSRDVDRVRTNLRPQVIDNTIMVQVIRSDHDERNNLNLQVHPRILTLSPSLQLANPSPTHLLRRDPKSVLSLLHSQAQKEGETSQVHVSLTIELPSSVIGFGSYVLNSSLISSSFTLGHDFDHSLKGVHE